MPGCRFAPRCRVRRRPSASTGPDPRSTAASGRATGRVALRPASAVPRARERPRCSAPLLTVTDLTVTYAPPRRRASTRHRRRAARRRPRGAAAARSSASSARPAPARPRWPAPPSAWSRPAARHDRVRRHRTSARCAAGRCASSAAPGRCSWSSRTRCARSTPTSPSAELVGEPLDVAGGLAARASATARVDEALRAGRASTPAVSAAATRASSPAASGSGSRWPGRSSTRPRLLFCDEPVSALDVSNRNLVLQPARPAAHASSAWRS